MRALFFIFAFLLSLGCQAESLPNSQLTGQWIFIIDQQTEHILTARGQLTASGYTIAGNSGAFAIRGSFNNVDVKLEWLKADGQVAITLDGQFNSSTIKG